MTMRLKLVVRNVFRNRRRTFINVLTIAAGVSAIVIFRGFAHNLIFDVQEVAVNAQYGHLQIANDKIWAPSAEDSPKSRLLTIDEKYLSALRAIPEVDYVSGRSEFYGLITSGDRSLSAKGQALDPGAEKQFMRILPMVSGKKLDANSKYEISLGSGLQAQLGLKIGSLISILAYTVDGSVNAIDVELVGVFQTGLSEVDNNVFLVPLAVAKTLLDTDKVEKEIVQLKDTRETEKVKQIVASQLPSGVGVRSWLDLATYYHQVINYYNVQDMIINWILMSLVLLSITNTVSMSITERFGEIGTIRAMGDRRSELLKQFLLEGLVLGLIGGLFGCVLGFSLSFLVSHLGIPIDTPGASHPLNITVDFMPSAYLEAMLMTCAMAVLATILPAYRASRMQIVDALRHNI